MPQLTERDPENTSEGSVDPLGTYAIADSLAVRMVPGVRERQAHPRFLTAMALALEVCSRFEDDEVAADGISEPWQVFEWYMVEGLVRKGQAAGDLSGLPGIDKVSVAVRENTPVSRPQYLKNPSVVGFHGVYRILARELGIEVELADGLGEAGRELLATWAGEQKLDWGWEGGTGRAWLTSLREAVADGLTSKAVARSPAWKGWSFFSEHLHHRCTGRREAKVLAQQLRRCDRGYRGEVFEFLVTPCGLAALGGIADGGLALQQAEPQLHQALLKKCSPELGELLGAIAAYEDFSRLLQNAFNASLALMARNRDRTTIKELSSLAVVKEAARRVPCAFAAATEKLRPFGDAEIRLQETFAPMSERLIVGEWVEGLLEHHRRVQTGKPPNGKAPWFDRYEGGACAIRQRYVRDYAVVAEGGYVHAYRTAPLLSFARDLHLVS